MKTRFLQLMILLLGLGLSCRKREAEPEKPINLATCRIVKETYKSVGTVSNSPAEVIKLEGKTFTVDLASSTYYTYDEKGRLVLEKYSPPNEDFYIRYTYRENAIDVEQRTRFNDKIVTKQVRVLLNNQGLDVSNQYDRDGYPIDSTYADGLVHIRRQNGNTTEKWEYYQDLTLIEKYKHDLYKANLPDRYPFTGKKDKNLLTQVLIESPDATIYKPGTQYRVNYYYEFDSHGRVKRMVRIGNANDYKTGWPFSKDGGHIGIFDYEYECP